MSVINTADYRVNVQSGGGRFRDILIDTDRLGYVTDIIMLYGSGNSVALGFDFLYDGLTYTVEGDDRTTYAGFKNIKIKKLLGNPEKYDPDLCRLRRDLMRYV